VLNKIDSNITSPCDKASCNLRITFTLASLIEAHGGTCCGLGLQRDSSGLCLFSHSFKIQGLTYNHCKLPGSRLRLHQRTPPRPPPQYVVWYDLTQSIKGKPAPHFHCFSNVAGRALLLGSPPAASNGSTPWSLDRADTTVTREVTRLRYYRAIKRRLGARTKDTSRRVASWSSAESIASGGLGGRALPASRRRSESQVTPN
jgi:hypothetical protein